MSWHNSTLIVMGVAVVLIALYDVVAWRMGGVQATISRITLAAVSRSPLLGVLVGLAIGVLMGHLFWSQPDPRCDPPALGAKP